MKTELEQCFRVRFPEIYPYGLMTHESDDECTVYRLLRYFGSYCSGHLESPENAEMMKVICIIPKTCFVKTPLKMSSWRWLQNIWGRQI